jgi:AraC-like DNA-binding protein
MALYYKICPYTYTRKNIDKIHIELDCPKKKLNYVPMPDTSQTLDLNYLYGGEIVCRQGESLATRTLTDYEYVYIITGNVSYTVNGTKHYVKQGSMILGRPGSREHYDWDREKPTRHAFFHFSIKQLPPDWPHPDHWPRIRENPSQLEVGIFRHILQHIYKRNNTPAAAPGRRDCMMVEVLIDTFLDKHEEKLRSFERGRPEPVRRALKWMRQSIDDNPQQKFTLNDIASASGCTPKHLCRIFKTSTGYSPAHTGTLMRLQLATALLASSNLSIKEISSRSGFANPLYFSRCFSKTFRRSPSAVRSDIARGVPPPKPLLPIDITPRICW